MPSSAAAAALAANGTIALEAQGYAKIVLHAAKYPASTVRGLLVGSSEGVSSGSFNIVDAIPLVHNWTDLTPVTEIGCALAQAHLSAGPNGSSALFIAGVYEAPSVLGVRDPSRASVKLARKIASLSNASSAVILVVNNTLLLSPSSGHALLPYLLSASSQAAASATATASLESAEPKSLPSASTVLVDESKTIAALAEAIDRGFAEHFVDFDDHLADTRKDWLSNSVTLTS